MRNIVPRNQVDSTTFNIVTSIRRYVEFLGTIQTNHMGIWVMKWIANYERISQSALWNELHRRTMSISQTLMSLPHMIEFHIRYSGD